MHFYWSRKSTASDIVNRAPMGELVQCHTTVVEYCQLNVQESHPPKCRGKESALNRGTEPHPPNTDRKEARNSMVPLEDLLLRTPLQRWDYQNVYGDARGKQSTKSGRCTIDCRRNQISCTQPDDRTQASKLKQGRWQRIYTVRTNAFMEQPFRNSWKRTARSRNSNCFLHVQSQERVSATGG
ncbi:hypothetical protein EMCG_08163 [[Emmonsia] crescens]|uniref:Uncharacterized protein n=1 Tax=[Emmonsia] crescens TaxID=73230 RepID=A0A0G2I6J6_9EURO|nr:hypothetical protein EMCG_08163 [Emmonsia crescens UAMH 3008]